MTKIVFLPLGICSGLLAGRVGRRTFTLIWGAVDRQPPPRPQERAVGLGRLALALALQGAVFGLVRGLADHASRRGFMMLTGRWPGEEQEPEPA